MQPARLFALLALTVVPILGASAASADQASETLLLQSPTISEDHIVFVYARDLWVVGREGGDARRLTSHVGSESNPHLSPDGTMVAFSGAYDGNTDVYVMPIDGGVPQRLTWHPASDTVQGWHPDGKRVLFSSARGGRPGRTLYLVSDEGGMPRELKIPRVGHASYNDTGDRIAYTPMNDAFRSWKRYRGGLTPPVWIYDPATHGIEQIPHVNASDTFPCWIGDDVYFASDRTNRMEIWKFTPGSKAPVQITKSRSFDVRSMSSGAGVLAYEQAGALHVYDPESGSSERLRITVRSDGLHSIPRWQTVRGGVRNAAISPNGKRAAFEARGEIITVPREHGAPRNITDSPGVHDRDPVWSPDGATIAWFSDAGGEYRLAVRDRRGREPITYHALGGAGFYHDPVWSPDGKHILFSDKGNRLAYITLETGKVTPISRTQGALGVWRPFGVWSPDSKWIAYEKKNPNTAYNGVDLFEVATGNTTPLTDAFSNADSPTFSRDGEHLFFRASVNSGPRSFGLDLSTSTLRTPSSSLYFVVLKKDGKNPLAARSDDEEPKPKKDQKKDAPKKDADKKDPDKKKEKKDDEDAPGKKDDEGDDEKDDEKKQPEDEAKPAAKEDDEGAKDDEAGSKEAAEKPSIDVEDIDQRILALPAAGSGTFYNLQCSHGKLLYLHRPTSGGGSSMKGFDFKSRKATDVMSGVSAFEVSATGKHVLVRVGSRWSVVNESGKGKKDFGIDNVKVRVVPELEWAADPARDLAHPARLLLRLEHARRRLERHVGALEPLPAACQAPQRPLGAPE